MIYVANLYVIIPIRTQFWGPTAFPRSVGSSRYVTAALEPQPHLMQLANANENSYLVLVAFVAFCC